MSVKSPEQFYDCLTKSKILDDAELKKAEALGKGIGNVRDVARKLVKADLLTKWQAAKLLSGKTNLTIGKYRLLGQIGGHSTGTVFLAEHAQMHRRVALKALLHRDHSPESTQKFLKQARAVSALEHPNLTRAYDIDIQDQYYYLVLEFVKGESVKQIVNEQGAIDQHATARYIRQVADALAYAHEKGLLHRDVRPANLMINDQDEVKVLNLGVVKLSDQAEPPAADSAEPSDLDHAAYLSPEQARGSETIDARSDIYSLGVVMFQMLTGELPIAGETYGEILKNHQSAKPKKILDLKPELSRDLAKICLKMLGKKREDRFQTAAQAVKFLDKWLASVEKSTAPAMVAEPEVVEEVEEYVEPVVEIEEVEEYVEPVAPGAPPVAAAPEAQPAVVAVADGPAPAAPEFSINTKGNAPSAAPSVAAAPRAASADPATVGKRAGGKSNMPLIIGGAIGGGVLALAAIVLIAMFVFGGDDETVAQNDPATTAGEANPNEVEPGEAPVPVAEPDEQDDPPGDATSGEPEPDEPAEPPAEEPGAIDLGNLLAGTPTPEETDPPEEPSEPEPAPDEPQEPSEPEPAENNPPAEPAENDPPAQQPKDRRTPAQKKEPLKQLKEVADLPQLARARGSQETEGVGVPISLGKVFDPVDEAVFVDLVGADQVKRGSVELDIERELPSAVDNRKWFIVLTSERESDDPRKIAEVAIDKFNFTFQWLPAAGDVVSDANSLRNCLLVVIIGKEEKPVALRAPTMLEPIEVNLSGKAARASIDIADLPDKDSLNIEITGVEGMPGKTSLPPPFPADAGGGAVGVGEPGQETLQFVIKSNASTRRPSLSVIPMFKIASMQKEQNFSKAAIGGAMNFYSQQQAAANDFLRQRSISQQQRTQAEAALNEANTAIEQITQLLQLEQNMAESGKIHYRVTYTVGTHQIVLASTGAAQ